MQPPPVLWPPPLPAHVRNAWPLRDDVTFLNHGSFGACPQAVIDAQHAWQARAEEEPVLFYAREWNDVLDAARVRLAAFVGASADDLVFVPNATTAVSTVLASLQLEPGDELLTTSHDYGACRHALNTFAARAGANVVVADIPFPLAHPMEVVDAVLRAVTARTKLALVDDITSPTGIVFPVAQLVDELRARGVDALVDGAHAIGQRPLDVQGIGAAYYTTNCHKWLCAPKGSALLVVARSHQERVRPLVVSHPSRQAVAARSAFLQAFDWTGTVDPSPHLAAADAISIVGALIDGGWSAIYIRNHQLAVAARAHLCNAIGVREPAPANMLGCMAAILLPNAPSPALSSNLPGFAHPLHAWLWEQHRIDVPVYRWPGPDSDHAILRLSAHLYNDALDYETLVHVLKAEDGPMLASII